LSFIPKNTSIDTDYNSIKVWDTFNEINGVEVCKKFELPLRWASLQQAKQAKESLVDKKIFPEHMDTENYFRNKHLILPNEEVYITQKLHWTSGRLGYVKAKRELSWKEKIAKRFGVTVEESKYDYVAWSRKVIKYGETWYWFYASDVWNATLEKYKTKIPKDYIIYWEIIWWVGDSPIQKWYTYHMPKGTNELCVYRIVFINADWIGVDLTQWQLIEFCEKNWFFYCPLISFGKHSGINIDQYMDAKLEEGNPWCIPLSPHSPCDEWVIIRRDWLTPLLLKAKYQTFLQHKSKVLDSWEEVSS